MKQAELTHLRTHHRELWNILIALENMPKEMFASGSHNWADLSGVSIRDKEKEFELEENQIRLF